MRRNSDVEIIKRAVLYQEIMKEQAVALLDIKRSLYSNYPLVDIPLLIDRTIRKNFKYYKSTVEAHPINTNRNTPRVFLVEKTTVKRKIRGVVHHYVTPVNPLHAKCIDALVKHSIHVREHDCAYFTMDDERKTVLECNTNYDEFNYQHIVFNDTGYVVTMCSRVDDPEKT